MVSNMEVDAPVQNVEKEAKVSIHPVSYKMLKQQNYHSVFHAA
jgi:hypothetical protein